MGGAMIENGWTRRIAELEAENKKLRSLILRRMKHPGHDGLCWCLSLQGGPMAKDHSALCREAQEVMRDG